MEPYYTSLNPNEVALGASACLGLDKSFILNYPQYKLVAPTG
jgi:hypothetical protein